MHINLRATGELVSKPKNELLGIDILRDLQAHNHSCSQLGHHLRSSRSSRRAGQLAPSTDRASIRNNLDCNGLVWIPHCHDMRTLSRYCSNNYHMVDDNILYHTGDVETRFPS